MKATFREAKDWHAAIAAAVREGLTFEAVDNTFTKNGVYVIEYTGGY
jgi:hypothetical protein